MPTITAELMTTLPPALKAIGRKPMACLLGVMLAGSVVALTRTMLLADNLDFKNSFH